MTLHLSRAAGLVIRVSRCELMRITHTYLCTVHAKFGTWGALWDARIVGSR